MVELIVVVLILGVLATVALPMMSGQSQEKSRFAEGVQALTTLEAAQQRYLLDHGSYTNDCANLDVDVTLANFNAPSCQNTGSVSITRSGGAAYTLTINSSGAFSCTGCPGYIRLP